MPKPIMDLWVTSSSDEEEDEEEVIPPPKKTKKPASEPPKSITKTTKVKPSKRVTRRNDIEDEDEDEGKFLGLHQVSSSSDPELFQSLLGAYFYLIQMTLLWMQGTRKSSHTSKFLFVRSDDWWNQFSSLSL